MLQQHFARHLLFLLSADFELWMKLPFYWPISSFDQLPESGLPRMGLPECSDELIVRFKGSIVFNHRIAALTLGQVAGGVAVAAGFCAGQRVQDH